MNWPSIKLNPREAMPSPFTVRPFPSLPFPPFNAGINCPFLHSKRGWGFCFVFAICLLWSRCSYQMVQVETKCFKIKLEILLKHNIFHKIETISLENCLTYMWRPWCIRMWQRSINQYRGKLMTEVSRKIISILKE